MYKFINNYIEPIALSLEQVAATLALPDGKYRLTIADNPNAATRWEIIDAVVASSSAELTRAKEGTVAQKWTGDSVIYNALTAETLNSILADIQGLKPDQPESSLLAVGTDDTVTLYDTNTGAAVSIFAESSDVLGVANGGRNLVVGHSNYIKIFNTITLDELKTITITSSEDMELMSVNTKANLLSIYPDLKVYSVGEYENVQIDLESLSYAETAINADGSIVAFAETSRNANVVFYRTSDWTKLSESVAEGVYLIGAGFDSTGSFIAIGEDSTLSIDPETGSAATLVERDWSGQEAYVFGAQVAMIRQKGSVTYELSVYEIGDSSLAYQVNFGADTNSGSWVSDVARSNTAVFLAAYGGSGINGRGAAIFKTENWELAALENPPTSKVEAVVFSSDDALCAITSNDAPYLRLYRTSDWTLLNIDADFSEPPASIALNG